MAGVFRKTMVYLGLVEPDDQHYDDEVLDLDEPELVPESSSVRPFRAGESPQAARRYADRGTRPGSNLAYETDVLTRSREDLAVSEPEPASYRITTICPTNYNDAREIGEQFRQRVPVIMNLTEMDDVNAKRLVDFGAGLTFGLHGSMERVTNKVFLLSPSNVEVSDADKARIREGGFFNQS